MDSVALILLLVLQYWGNIEFNAYGGWTLRLTANIILIITACNVVYGAPYQTMFIEPQ